MRLQNSLSIVTVAGPGDGEYIKANVELIALLNRDSDYRVYVLDNRVGPDSEQFDIKSDLVTVLEGVPQDTSYSAHCRGSYHHAAALNRFLCDNHIETRYLLILDPDFYILHEAWIENVLSYMDEKNLSFFGASWHPKWFTKYRYFPCAHCMFVDQGKVNPKDLDFTPDLVERSLAKEKKIKKMQQKRYGVASNGISSNECSSRHAIDQLRKETYWPKILLQVVSMSLKSLEETYAENDLPLPYGLRATTGIGRSMRGIGRLPGKMRIALKKILKCVKAITINRRLVGSSNDTGYLIQRSFEKNEGHKSETVQPVVNYQTDFRSPPHLRVSCGRWFEKLFPDSLSFMPKSGTFVTEKDAGEADCLSEIDSQWERFMWNEELFGFHMRRYNQVDREPQEELRCLRTVVLQRLERLQIDSREDAEPSSFFCVEQHA